MKECVATKTKAPAVLHSAGAVALDGVGMLAHQAARAFSLWTGHPAPIEVMITAARHELRNA